MSAKFTFFVSLYKQIIMSEVINPLYPNLTSKHRFQPGNNVGGRRPKAVELKAREFILKVIGGDAGVKKLIAKIFQQALRGNFKQQELLLNYIMGKPIDRVKIESNYGTEAAPGAVIKIIADNLRLEKLRKDAEAAPELEQQEPIAQERIDEMERILNAEVNRPTLPDVVLEENTPAAKPIKKLKASNKVKTKKKKKL